MFAYLGLRKDFVCFNYSLFGTFKVKVFAGGFGNYCTFLEKEAYKFTKCNSKYLCSTCVIWICDRTYRE